MSDGHSNCGQFVGKILVFWKGAWSLTRGVSTVGKASNLSLDSC